MDGVHPALEAAMCYRSSHEYERRFGAGPTQSFFAALRDLFRRQPKPQVEAPEVAAPAQVIPLRAEAANCKVERERADAA
jgi:hypothetical protein